METKGQAVSQSRFTNLEIPDLRKAIPSRIYDLERNTG